MASSTPITMQAMPMTGRLRSESPQAFRRDDSAARPITTGIVASTIQTAKRKSQAPKSRRAIAAERAATTPRTSLQK